VSAAAYRAGEKLHSHAAGSAAYRAGEEIREKDGEIVHDYTKKGGVVHSEIILPNGAPLEYKDRETLWNAVERAEKRKDAQLAREINVALPTEFDLEEQKALLREYIKENFVDKGMIADFTIHHAREENPHAHIMLTTRTVTPDGFGNKNRDWNSIQNLVDWREDWADKTNRMLEQKGLEERIDHRTLKAQGIDREPTIHMGAEATALERRGIRTELGDYNREIKRRNQERAVQQENAGFLQVLERVEKSLEARKTAKTAQPIEKQRLYETETSLDAPSLEEQLKAEKATQHVEKMQEQRKARELAEINPRMDEIENEFFAFKWELRGLKEDCIAIRRDIPPLEYRAENIDEYVQIVNEKQKATEHPRQERLKAHWWEFEKKTHWDEQIRKADRDFEFARQYFTRKFKIEPEQAPAEIDRLQKIVRKKELEIAQKEARMNKIDERQEVLKTEYQALKLRKDVYRDREQERAHDEELAKIVQIQIQSARERQIHEQIIHELNTITEEGFQKALEKLSYEEAQTLIEIRETAKAEGLIKERRRNRTRTIGRSR
jgi:archaellum component FlaC